MLPAVQIIAIRVRAVSKGDRLGDAEIGTVIIVIAILIVDPENLAQLPAGFRQAAHTVRTAGCFVRRERRRVQVVVAVLSPAVEMGIRFIQPAPLQFPKLFGAYVKGSISIVDFRMLRIIKMGFGSSMICNLRMDDWTTEQPFCSRIALNLLLQRNELTALLQIRTITFSDHVIIALLTEAISHASGVS